MGRLGETDADNLKEARSSSSSSSNNNNKNEELLVAETVAYIGGSFYWLHCDVESGRHRPWKSSNFNGTLSLSFNSRRASRQCPIIYSCNRWHLLSPLLSGCDQKKKNSINGKQ